MPLPAPEPARPPGFGDDHAIRQQLVTGLIKIGLATRHHAWAGGEPRGLSPTQGQILALLLANEPHGAKLTDVARDLAITQPTVSVAVRTLIEKGLVVRTPSANDRRVTILTLSPDGRSEAANARSWTDFLASATDDLDPEEQAVFQRSIVKMIRGMQLRGEIPVSRMCVTCRYFRPQAHPGEQLPHHCAYVDAAFGDRQLRLDCVDFEPATAEAAQTSWDRFVGRKMTVEQIPIPAK
jgi:DNA-binding MarR family transcriptional regulator